MNAALLKKSCVQSGRRPSATYFISLVHQSVRPVHGTVSGTATGTAGRTARAPSARPRSLAPCTITVALCLLSLSLPPFASGLPPSLPPPACSSFAAVLSSFFAVLSSFVAFLSSFVAVLSLSYPISTWLRNHCERARSPVDRDILEQDLVVAAEGDDEDDGLHVVEAVDPLAPLAPLPPDVHHAEVVGPVRDLCHVSGCFKRGVLCVWGAGGRVGGWGGGTMSRRCSLRVLFCVGTLSWCFVL